MVNIRKSNGEMQKYNPHKLKRSLMNSGADRKTAFSILNKVDKMIYNGMSTKELFRFAFKELRKAEPYIGLRYDLRNAIMRLGPKGFAFEKLVEAIMKKKGYNTQRNQNISGRHITHEIDIVAKKGKEVLMIEAKYHNKPWIYTSVQTGLYVYARFLDVRESFTSPMIVTNTKFSHQVKNYSKGVGVRLMGWKYPKGDSLEENVENFGIYPVTMLPCINRAEAELLVRNNVVLIQNLIRKTPKDLAELLKVPVHKAEKILNISRTCVTEIKIKKK